MSLYVIRHTREKTFRIFDYLTENLYLPNVVVIFFHRDQDDIVIYVKVLIY